MNNEQLAAQAQPGSQPALYALWEQVERLVYSKFRGLYYHYGPSQCAAHGVTLDDLYQEGWFAFLAAVRAYKPGGWKFNTYLHYACKNRFRAAMGTDRPRPLDMADSLTALFPVRMRAEQWATSSLMSRQRPLWSGYKNGRPSRLLSAPCKAA